MSLWDDDWAVVSHVSNTVRPPRHYVGPATIRERPPGPGQPRGKEREAPQPLMERAEEEEKKRERKNMGVEVMKHSAAFTDIL